MILDIRGTNGSGKSYIPHNILQNFDYEFVLDTEGDHLGYYVPWLKLAIVGRYDSVCGGCDRIYSPGEVCDTVRALAEVYPNVMLEGLLVSHTFGRYDVLRQEFDDYRFLFLDTPEAICKERVIARRVEKGNHEPYDPKNMVKDWHQCRRVAEKFQAVDANVWWLDHRLAYEATIAMLRDLKHRGLRRNEEDPTDPFAT
jgi:hypothetical protein